MNKDKRTHVLMMAKLCGAYSGTRAVIPPKVLMVIRDSVRELADGEERAIRKMQPFKDNVGTATNYRAAISCREDLRSAQDALEEGEVEEAHPLLLRIALGDDAEPVPAVQATPKLKTRRRA